MGKNGLGKKLVFAAAAVGAILLVLRLVGGRGETGVGEDAIDRVDTGRSEESGGGSVETGLERVSTSDDEDEDDGDTTADDETDEDADEESDEIAVEATGGRFDDLDLFDYVAILGAAAEAAREEYRNRS
jgi:hypothetical protein